MSVDVPSAKYWLIAVPKATSGEDGVTLLRRKVSQTRDLATAYRFSIPSLRVGTLDALFSLSDELARVDANVESVVKRLHTLFFAVSERSALELAGGALTAPRGADIDTYCCKFVWDEQKYPKKTPLRSLVNIMQKRCAKIEESAKQKSADWAATMQAMAAASRRTGGNLLARDLDAELVKPDENIVETENLTTLLIVVPASAAKAWEKQYESLTQFVVPRSSRRIAADKEHALYRVVLFRRVADDFKNAVRDKRWAVRDFVAASNSDADRRRLEADKDKQRKVLLRWCKANFAEAFACYVHIKAIRTFVESVLRYCVPPNFDAILVHPHAKMQRKVMDVLHEEYAHVTSATALGGGDDDDAALAASGAAANAALPGRGEFHPFVFTALNVDFGGDA